MHHVYVLFSLSDRQLYIGYSSDLSRRLAEHDNGNVIATVKRRPLKLIYSESYISRQEALRREKFLRGGNGRAQLKKQLVFTLNELGYKHL